MMQMALALFGGEVGPTWNARAGRARSILGAVIGDEPPNVPVVPPDLDGVFPHPRMRPTNPGRPKALEAAEDLFDGIVRRRFSRLEGLLEEEVWVIWPTGHIGRHPRDALIEAFDARPGKPAPMRVVDRQSYTFVELKQVLARGLPKLLDVVLGARSALTVTLGIDSSRGPVGRVMFVMAADERGEWRARNLMFGSVDDAHVASAKRSSLRDEPLKVADRVVRRVVLGHGAQLAADRNLMMEQIFLRDQLGPAEALIERISAGDHRLGSSEVVFMGSQELPYKIIAKHTPPGTKEKLERIAPNAWGRSIDRMDPRLVATQLGALDPATLEVTPMQQATALVIRVEDRARDQSALRIAALFM